MRRFSALIAAAALAVPTFVAFAATPASAGSEGLVTVEGTAHCNVATGHETYTLTWTVTNGLVPPDDLNIGRAIESGAFTGSVALTPNPIPGGEDATATGSDGPVPNMAGTVTLTVDFDAGEGSDHSVGQIVLDGNCTLPATTSVVPATTTTVKAAALAVTPRFTG